MTLQEEIRSVAKDVQDLKHFLKAEPANDSPVFDYKPIIESIKSEVSKIKIDIPKAINTETVLDYDLKEFNKKRWFSVIVMTVLFSVLSYTFHVWNLEFLFIISTGFLIASVGLIFLLLLDVITTYGDSFDTIRKNPISLSILLFIISLFFAVGVFVSKDFIPNSFKSEPSFKNDVETTVPTKEIKNGYDSTAYKVGTDDVESKGIPNR